MGNVLTPGSDANMSTTIHERRDTIQQEPVQRTLETIAGFASAGDRHNRLNDEGNPVGLATVYRQLNTLVEAGRADTAPATGGQLLRACEPGTHHHHLICESCRTAVEIDPPDEDRILASAARNGFTVTRHMVEAFGRCADCLVA